jgi:hypothetical protein
MGSEKLPQSPFPPDGPPDRSVKPVSEPGIPDQPRLGIIHFLVWMACAAVYLGMNRVWGARVVACGLQDPEEMVFVGLKGIGAAAALGGLALWAARRSRDWRFPRYPGEYLLVVLGVSALLSLVVFVTSLAFDPSNSFTVFFLSNVSSVLSPIPALLLVWAAVFVKVPRWRWLFYVSAASQLLPALGSSGIAFRCFHLHEFVFYAVWAWLAVVVISDHLRSLRYPWTHWLGVAVYLWSGAVAAGWYVWLALGTGTLN